MQNDLKLLSYLRELGYNKREIQIVLKNISYLIDEHVKSNFSGNLGKILKNGSPIFVAYPDQVISSNKSGITVLDKFVSKYFPNMPVYILPPWEDSGDGGFCIKDFKKTRTTVGNTSDLINFCTKRPVVLDVVFTNISVENNLVNQHLNSPYTKGKSIVAELVGKSASDIPVSHRGHSNVREFYSKYGMRWLWTTFSPDQVNLNYSSPQTLIWLLDTIAYYLDLGAQSIRLDAVPFSWTRENGPELHVSQCHSLVKVVRHFLDMYKPNTLLIAQADYDSKPLHDYIGKQNNEAHLLYRHELVPLIIHAILSGNNKYMGEWIDELAVESDTNWISFLSTCDGIFLRPWEYPLPPEGINLLVDACDAGGGIVQHYHWENHPPATLCTTTYSILSYKENEANTIKRLILSYAMLLALPGIPALYFNSILGMKNWTNWKEFETEARSIVREKYSEKYIKESMSTPKSVQNTVYKAIKSLIDIRIQNSAISQNSKIKRLDFGRSTLLSWTLEDNDNKVFCYFNLGHEDEQVKLEENLSVIAGKQSKGSTISLSAFEFTWVGTTP